VAFEPKAEKAKKESCRESYKEKIRKVENREVEK
jgi:hypothetical protein